MNNDGQSNKQRNTTQSSAKQDDHYTYRNKQMYRQRSHSKDSNDGFTKSTNLNSGNGGSNNLFVSDVEHSSNNEKTSCSNSDIALSAASQISFGTHIPKTIQDRNNIVLKSELESMDEILMGINQDLESFTDESWDKPVSVQKPTRKELDKPTITSDIFEMDKMKKTHKRKAIEINNHKNIGEFVKS